MTGTGIPPTAPIVPDLVITPAIAPALGGHIPLSVVQGSTKGSGATPTSHGLKSAAGRVPTTKHSHSGGTPVAEWIALAAALVLLVLALRVTVRLRDPTNDELLAELEQAFSRSGRRMPTGTTLAGLEQRVGGRCEPSSDRGWA